MKLKYYLRGFGIGVILATIVMMVSGSLHRGGLTDEQIIKEAQKLGMIMKDSEDKNGLWGDSKDETEKDNTEGSGIEDSEKESEKPSESQMTEETQTSEGTQMPSEEQTQQEELPQQESQNPSTETPVYVTVSFRQADTASVVVEKLYQAGLIRDKEDFHKYLKSNGYTKIIRGGTFEIKMGSTYEEICMVIIRMELAE